MSFGRLAALWGGVLLAIGGQSFAQDPNPAMNAPDQFAWESFIKVNQAATGTNALFETWASDTDTFKPQPAFPPTPAPLALHAPAVAAAGRAALQRAGHILPQVPPGAPDVLEESRRNEVAFSFIVSEGLYKISGLKAAFGKTLSFPIGSTEVKANWLPVNEVPAFTLNRVAAADVAKYFHVNTGSDGKQYALLSMHVITKDVPNWTWATFENEYNPSRCDILGCNDGFGAMAAHVKPNEQAGKGYPPCAKTAALTALFAASQWDGAFSHYCLKGTQTDFTDNTGLANRLGNSVTEDGFVDQSSCMTCHSRALFDKNGKATTGGGFDNNGAPLGPPQVAWSWQTTAKPPIYVGMQGLTRTATSADFIWSVPFCAINDTVSPVKPSSCAGK